MKFIENFAKDSGCLSVRLDTFSQNKKNNNLYSKLGYKKLGKIYFRDQRICRLTVMKVVITDCLFL